MPLVGNVSRFAHKYRYHLEIGDFMRVAFTTCSELSAEVAKIEHWEGGRLIPYKEPGRTTFADITLTRGVTFDRESYDWFVEVINVVADTGRISPDFKRDLDIVQLDRDGSEMERYTIEGAWPTKFVAGDWDNGADEVRIEQLVLTFDLFKRFED